MQIFTSCPSKMRMHRQWCGFSSIRRQLANVAQKRNAISYSVFIDKIQAKTWCILFSFWIFISNHSESEWIDQSNFCFDTISNEPM